MSNELSHIDQALHNQTVIDSLALPNSDMWDWVTTIAFYKALHLVEAVFSNDKEIGHGINHENREKWLKTKPKYQQIAKYYRPLWAASMIARYLQDEHGKFFNCFSDYLPPDKVKSDILNHYLHQVQKASEKFFSTGGKDRLAGKK